MRAIRSSITLLAAACVLSAQDARDIVRKSVELDQSNWLRMRDYTWIAEFTERHFDRSGNVTSKDEEQWETTILSGQPYRRMLMRKGKPLSGQEQRDQQRKLDKAVAKLQNETSAERKRRMARYEKERAKDREFLREIPNAYDFRLEASAQVDGNDTWVIAATPHSGFVPAHGEGKAFAKIRGKLWIDKAEHQWVRLEAETTDTISFGWFLARLDSGAKLVFEQTRVNDEVWLPKREYVQGTGRIGLLKRVAMDQDLKWTRYRKFRVDSSIVTTQ